MKACRQSRRWLELQFAGELSWKQELRLQEHLADCPACADLSRAQDQVLESLGSYREAPLAKVDVQRFVERVQARIGDEPVGVAQQSTAESSRTIAPYLVAAVVLVALGLPWVLKGSSSSPDGGSDPATDQGLENVSKTIAEDPIEVAQALTPSPAGDDSEFRAERHQAAVTDLRGALASVMGDSPDWELYTGRANALRSAGWPMASLLTGLLGDEHLETAKAAVLALGKEGGRLAHRRLWNLRSDERLGGFAVRELQAGGILSVDQAIELYWEGDFREVALDGFAGWDERQAMLGAKQLVQEAPMGQVPVESMPVIARVLQRAGDEGSTQALAWLESGSFAKEEWAAEVARSLDLSGVLDEYLSAGAGTSWESSALVLASHHGSEDWIPFLRKCSRRSRTASRAVQALEGQPGLAALELLLAQENNRMVSEDVWLAAWSKALALDGPRLVVLAKSLRAGGSRSELEHFADVLLLGDQAGSGKAMMEIAMASDLPERLRCTLVLKAGRLNEEGTAYGLETLFSGLNRNDAELAACIVVALSNSLDAEIVADLLGRTTKASGEVIRQILALCDKQTRRSERERRYLIARKLKKVLGRRNLSSLE